MKTSKFITVAILLASSISFVACNKKEGDTTKPEINLVSPAEGDTLFAGGEHGIHFEMEVSDDVALGSYKVDIHNAFDGHSHKSEEVHEHEGVAFAYNNSWNDIKDKRNADIHHHEIVIPANAAHGEYHFVVYCTDAAGNESKVVRNVVIAEGKDHDH